MQFDFAIPGNGAQVVDVVGRFVKYVSGAGKIRVRLDKGGYLDLLPGQGAKGLDFARLQIEDRSGAGNYGVLLAGNFEFQDDRVSGDVSIIDGGKNRTIANQTFMMAASNGPTAGQYAVQELWNPAGSGKRIIVEQAQVSSGAASNILCGWTATRVGSGAVGAYSKMAGGVNSTGATTFVSLAALPGFFNYLTTTNVQANAGMLLSLREPLVIPPGFGFIVANSTVSNSLQMYAEFFEEGI